MTAKEHNRLVGIFLMVHGGLQGLVMLLIGLIYGGIGAAILIGAKNSDKPAGLIMLIVVAFIAIFSAIFVAPQILGGFKMFKEKPNAKIWGIIGSIISTMFFPLGTAAGVYGLWFLFGEEGKRFYDNSVQQNYLEKGNSAEEFKTDSFRQDSFRQTEREPHSWR